MRSAEANSRDGELGRKGNKSRENLLMLNAGVRFGGGARDQYRGDCLAAVYATSDVTPVGLPLFLPVCFLAFLSPGGELALSAAAAEAAVVLQA